MNNQNYASDSKYLQNDFAKESGFKNSNCNISVLSKYSPKDKVAVLQSSNTHEDVNEGSDYEAVMKQFDDLMFELSNSRNTNKVTVDKSKYVDQIDKSYGPNEKFEKPEYYNDKKAVVWNEAKVLNYSLGAEQSSNSTNLKHEKHPDLNNVAFSNDNLNPNPTVEKRIPWINSHLWDLENKLDSSHFEKSDSKARKDFLGDSLTVDSRDGSVFNAAFHPLANISQNTNASSLVSYLQEIQRNDERARKYDSKTFSHSESHCRGKHMYDAKLKYQGNKIGVTTSLVRSPKTSRSPLSKCILSNNCFLVRLYIETKDLHLGPFSFEIYPKMSLRLLKLKVEQEHGISSSSQKWILGKCFADDNEKSLADYNVLPGSSIIVYVDNKQNESQSRGTKNEKTNAKGLLKRNDAFGNEDRSESFDSSSSRCKPKEMRKLARKDSLDSKLAKPCSETNIVHNRKFSYHSSDNDSVDMPIRDMKDSLKNIKIPVIKKKVLQKGIASKKKTLVEEKNDLHSFDMYEKSHLDLEGTNHSKNLLDCCVLSSEIDSVAKDKLSGVSMIGTAPEKLPFISFSKQSVNCGNTLTTSTVNIFTQSNQQASSSKTLPVFQNLEKENLEGCIKAHQFNCSKEKPDKELHKISDLNLKNDYRFDSEGDILKITDNSFLLPENVQNLCEGIKMDHMPFNEKKIMNKACITDCVRKLDDENVSCTSEKVQMSNETIHVDKQLDVPLEENLGTIQLDTFNVNKLEGINDLCSTRNSQFKRKTSVTSLIRKLSLTRKAKSMDDASCSHFKMSNEVQSEEICEEKDSGVLVIDSNKNSYSSVLIEILSGNQVTIPPENEIVAPCSNENMQGEQCNQNTPIKEELESNTPSKLELESIKNFELLLEIENLDLVENTTNFTCPVCFDEFESGQGVILHDCLHTFCRECLSNSVSYSDGALVKCPYRDDFYSCQSHLQQREIKALVSGDLYEKYLQRSITTAEGLADQSFHCKTPDCPGWCIYDNAKNVFHCPACFHYNCLNCQAIHEGLNCRQYQEKLKLQQKEDKESEKTLELLNKMIESGKALHCPKCDLILMKKWGCDWLKCSVCKTEICWITRGPRWGPGGQGDTSGGCKCGVNGIKCHPSCTYCH